VKAAPPVEALGDAAVLVRLGEHIDEPTLRRVRAATARLARLALPAVSDVVAAFNTVAVHYDPAQANHARIAGLVADALRELDDEVLPEPRTHVIPVRYGGGSGPDLERVAAHAGIALADVVRRHTAREYLVYMIGFAPGFPYLGGLDPALACPRRETPRTHVPAGSVGIGGSQTGIYPVESPGGWQLIGRTVVALFDATRTPPALLVPGDRVRFTSVNG
jgi:inhibitor of KinA